MVRRSPSPDCPPSGRAVGVRQPRAVGAGVWVWGPKSVSLACMPSGGCVPWGSPDHHPLRGRQPGFRDPCVPVAVGGGVGTQHGPHSVRPCGPALLAVGVAEGHPRGGCLAPL